MKMNDISGTWITVKYVAGARPPKNKDCYFSVWMRDGDEFVLSYEYYESARLAFDRLITALTDLEG